MQVTLTEHMYGHLHLAKLNTYEIWNMVFIDMFNRVGGREENIILLNIVRKLLSEKQIHKLFFGLK
jgi:hypothetical protein